MAMKWLQNLAAKYLGDSGWTVLSGARSGFSNLSIPQQLAEYKGWIYATGNAIADEVSMTRWVLKQRRGEEEVVIMRHPLLDLLNRPHGHFTSKEMLKLLALHIFITGKGYWHVNRVRGIPRELSPLYVDRVGIKRSQLEHIEGYYYYTTSGQVNLSANEVIPFRNIDPSDFFNGVGIVDALSTVIQSNNEALKATLAGFKNMSNPGGIIKTEQKMTEQAIKQMARQWRDAHQGSENTNKIAVLDKGGDFKEIGSKAKDIELLDGRKYNEHTVRGTARVPGAALGIEATSNRSTAEANDYTFNKRVIKPVIATIADALQHHIVSDYGNDLILDYVDPIPPDKEFNLRRQTESVKVPWKTINEARAEAGLPPIEGGEKLYVPNNFAAIDRLNQPPQPVAVPVSVPQPEEEEVDEE